MFVAIALGQFIGLVVWTLFKWHRYAYTYDFAIYYQAAYLISHGHFNPFSTVLGFPFIQNDFEIVMWPVGWLLAIIHSPFFLPLLQDFALGLTTWITLKWMQDVLNQFHVTRVDQVLLQTLGVVFIVGTPWIYWTASFDFHIEPLVLPFVVLAGWNFWKDQRVRGYVWTAMFLLGGNVPATYVFGLGVMEIFLGRKHWKNGVVLLLLSGIALVAIEKLVPGGIRGGNLSSFYGYLVSRPETHITIMSVILGLLSRPGNALAMLWYHRFNIIGEVSPAGLLGILSPMGVGISLVVLLTDNLIGGAGNVGFIFGAPEYFQGITTVPFVAVGTVFALSFVRPIFQRRWRIVWYTGVVALLFNTMVWFALFVPQIPSHLVDISPEASRILSSLQRDAARDQEVVSTQAFVGRFSGRTNVSTFARDGSMVPVVQHRVIFLVSPYQGIEASSVVTELARIWNLAHLRDTTLIRHGGGIWAFQLHSVNTGYNLNLNVMPKLFPAWALNHPAGHPILSGPVSQWHITSSGHAGYLVDGFYKRVNPGSFKTIVNLSSTTPVTIEIWNDTGSYLVRRDTIVPTNGTRRTVTISFVNRKFFSHANFFRGYGLWTISPPPPPSQDQLEIRIWSSGQGVTNVYGLNIVRNKS